MAVTTQELNFSTFYTQRGKSSNQPVTGTELAYLAANNAALSKDEANDSFWEVAEIDAVRWDKLYPYQLIVVDVKVDSSGNISYTPHKNAIFTLPFPPESLTKSTPFASTVDVTLGGIVEQNNGAPIRTLQFRGTTGYLPLRGTSGQGTRDINTFTGGLVQGTINSIAGIVTDARSFATAIGLPAAASNVHLDSDFTSDSALAKTTGYYQIHKLKEFLEQYAAVKKTAKGRSLRLAVANWKDNEVLLATPLTFVVNKDVSSPLEYKYSLDFEGWKRIDLEVSGNVFQSPTPARTSPTALARIINVLSVARQVIRDAGNVPQALLGDLNHINEIFRQSIGFCKDLAGTIQNFADLPDAVKTTIKNAVYQDGRDFKNAGKQLSLSAANFKSNILNPMVGVSSFSTTTTQNTRHNIVARRLEDTQLDNITIDQFSGILSPQTKLAVNKDIANNRKLTRNDFEGMRDDLEAFANKMAFLMGAGNDDYQLTYSIENIRPLKEVPTDGDWEVLYSLTDSVMALDELAATGTGAPSEVPKLMDNMATLARASGIAFKVPTSKFAVPFPYGATIESLAAQYLGDPNRALEIVTLNGLREPYVDETGFDLPLLVNAALNTVIVAYSDQLYVGQKVTIGSTKAIKTVRKITKLTKDLNNNLTVTLDGSLDLGKYKVNDFAVLHAYLPDTVNSQNLIYIPSDQDPVENDYLTKDIPTVNTLDPMVVVGGVDLLLDSSKDLIFTDDGDSRLASGLTNIIQGKEIEFSVEQGKLLLHPDYGIPVRVGSSTADIDAKSILTAVKRMFLNDPTFSQVGAVRVKTTGAAMSIDTSAVVSGTSKFLPLSFGLK